MAIALLHGGQPCVPVVSNNTNELKTGAPGRFDRHRPVASPRSGACRRRCRRFGFPVRAGKTRSNNGMPRSRAETWIQARAAPGPERAKASSSYAAVTSASILVSRVASFPLPARFPVRARSPIVTPKKLRPCRPSPAKRCRFDTLLLQEPLHRVRRDPVAEVGHSSLDSSTWPCARPTPRFPTRWADAPFDDEGTSISSR